MELYFRMYLFRFQIMFLQNLLVFAVSLILPRVVFCNV